MDPAPSQGSERPPTIAARPATSGELHIRVRYVECDPMGVAHHASYLAWLEMARTELLRSSGISYADLEREGYLLVIAKLDVRYRESAAYDDELVIRCRVVGGSRVKIDHEYEVLKQGRVITAARTTLACVGRDGKVRTMPSWLITE